MWATRQVLRCIAPTARAAAKAHLCVHACTPQVTIIAGQQGSNGDSVSVHACVPAGVC